MKKTIISLSIIAAVCLVAGAFFFLFSNDPEPDYKQKLSDRISIYWYGGKKYYVDTETGEKLFKNLDVDWIYPLYEFRDKVYSGEDSLTVLFVGDKRGFVNINTGEIIIPPTYRHAWVFSEGLAAVVMDNMVGFINRKGEMVIDCRYPYRGNKLTDFVFKNGRCVVADSMQRVGVIDTLGNWVLEPKYDFIRLEKDYAIVYKIGQCKKQVDYAGNVLADGLIDWTSNMHYYKTYVNKQTGESSKVKVQNEHYMMYCVEDKFGIVSRSGKHITPPIYTGIYCEDEELFCARITKIGEKESYVLINGKGEIISRRHSK